jgi:hypothetical protein
MILGIIYTTSNPFIIFFTLIYEEIYWECNLQVECGYLEKCSFTGMGVREGGGVWQRSNSKPHDFFLPSGNPNMIVNIVNFIVFIYFTSIAF